MATEAPKSIRVRSSTAQFDIRAKGRKQAPLEDLYHTLLTVSWSRFFASAFGLYVGLNAFFACLYACAPGCVSNVESPFPELFFFSVQTMSTIGYGTMSPMTTYSNVLVSLEALVGMMSVALVTGITFSKFAKPTAKVLFSDKCVVGKRNGQPHLMFRMANWRHNQIVEAQLRVSVIVLERTLEGDEIRRPREVILERSSNAVFFLSWLALHKIDESSPFFGEGFEKLRDQNSMMIISLTGYDDTMGQTVHARHTYRMDDVHYDARFVDVITTSDDGTREIDYTKFHDVELVGDAFK